MKKNFAIYLFLLLSMVIRAQNSSREMRLGGSSYIKPDKSMSGKSDTEPLTNRIQPALGNENVSYGASADMITILVESGENRIQLMALTGQILFNGNLAQGKFVIPTQRGIYILKINNKSYKVVCK